MFKPTCSLFLMLFIFMATFTPYASTLTDFNFTQNSEEKEVTGEDFEKEFLTYQMTTVHLKTHVQFLIFPSYIELKPQMVSIDVLKPPLA